MNGKRYGMILTLVLLAAGVLFAADQRSQITFTDITSAAGIKFVHNAGKTGKKYLPETLGAGGAFLDADGDGWPDILLINGKDFSPRGRRSLPRSITITRTARSRTSRQVADSMLRC